jgi:hypothetical protein
VQKKQKQGGKDGEKKKEETKAVEEVAKNKTRRLKIQLTRKRQ